MAKNVHLTKKDSENNVSLLRRFNRKMGSSGVINRVKSIRYNERTQSDFKKKKQTLMVMRRQKEYEQLAKLGKVADTRFRR
jgi:hypothetical protein